jgi:cysteine-rich repeat protein
MRTRISAFILAALAAATPALASFHLVKVRSVFPGTVSAPDAQFVVLQSYAAGQNFFGSHKVHVYDAAGVEVTGSPFTFPGTLANGPDQMTALIATPEATTLFGLTSDLAMTPVLPLTGGKVCWDAIDCVAWGSYHGSTTGVGTPFNVPVGLERGQAMTRRLDICMGATTLEACDDTGDSANDFVFAAPAPKNNAGTTGAPPASTCGNNTLESLEGCDDGNTADGDGCSAVCQPEPAAVVAAALVLEDTVVAPVANGILEPGETAIVAPAWTNGGASAVALTGTAASLTGPAGATYTLLDSAADYGSIAPAATASCSTGIDCYQVSVSNPASRPAQHWDAMLTEVLSNTGYHGWTLHVGESFPDAPNSLNFYPFIENLFHNGITGGCGGGNYCPTNPVTRAQMAVFLLKAKLGSAHMPPPCTGTVFTDVPCTGGAFDPWIEELAGLGITGGCGGGLYCPDGTVTRQQMAVFLLKAKEGSAYDPPDCAGVFADVPCTPGAGFSDWIEELYNRQITGGCSVTPLDYCPTNPNNRGQMAVFLVKTFGLLLYAP